MKRPCSCIALLYAGVLLLQSCTSNVSVSTHKQTTNPNSQITVDNRDEKKEIKQAAINFYKWFANVWEQPVNAKLRAKYTNQILLDRNGKIPTDIESPDCPCTLNTKVETNFFSWIRKVGPIISEEYILTSQQALTQSLKTLNEAVAAKDGDVYGAIEELVVSGMFHIDPGNGGAPDLNKSTIFTSKAIWEIDEETNSTATVNTTLRAGKGWDSQVMAYKIFLVKERGAWKLAGPMEEGVINQSFK